MITSSERGKPLYEQLRQSLRSDILSGVYPPGSQLPSELELGAHYGVSRITVRRAMMELVQEGLLIRMQGKGTFVLSSDTRMPMDTQCSFWETFEQDGHRLTAQVVSRTPRVWLKEISWLLGVDNRPCALFQRVLKRSGSPLVLENVYYLPERLGIAADELEHLPFCRIGGEKEPSGKVRREIRASIIDGRTAQFIGCTEGEPAFQVTQICSDENGMPVVVSRSYFPGSWHCFLLEDLGRLQIQAPERPETWGE